MAFQSSSSGMWRLGCVLVVFACSLAPASAGIIVADLITTTFGTSSAAPGSVYDTASILVAIDPAATDWMALSIGSALRTNLPNLAGIPTIQSTQMDDSILLTASLNGATSPQITLDDNGSFNQRIGNQAIFYGFFPSVGSWNGFNISTYAGLPETGALTSFFDTQGAGTYTLSLQFYNKYSLTAGHSSVYLLREVQEEEVIPEPATLSLLGLGLLAVARRRRKR